MYANGISQIKICNILNAEGRLNQYGRPFNQRTVKYMLSNEKYIGNYIFTVNGEERYRHNGIIPQIIDLDLWEKVQNRLSQTIKRKSREERDLYLLTGKIYCAHCKEPFIGGGGDLKRIDSYSYRCRGRREGNGCTMRQVNKQWLEKSVFDLICDEILLKEKRDEICKLAFNAISENTDTPHKTMSKLKAEPKQH